MNSAFLDTIYLFSCGANGRLPVLDHELDIKQIYAISQSQAIWETVFVALKKAFENDSEIMQQKDFDMFYGLFLQRCGIQYQKYDFIHKLISILEDNDIKPCLLKGEAIARFYDTPIARISSDVDILIDPTKLDLCLKLMAEQGFEVGEKNDELHHVECNHPKYGLVEIHIAMCSKKTADLCLRNLIKYNEDYITVTAEDGQTYKTLGITDGFLYLMVHFIKHFLSSGCGIRQLSDVLVYVKSCYNDIDWNRCNDILSQLQFKKIFNYMIAIGIKYLGFPEALISVSEVDDGLIEQIFDDMIAGGVYGHDAEDRAGFYDLYLEERCKKTGIGSYETYKNKRKLKRLFPNRNFMSINFSYVEKSILLLPVAWIHRIIKGILPQKKENPFENEQQKRLELIEKLGMI